MRILENLFWTLLLTLSSLTAKLQFSAAANDQQQLASNDGALVNCSAEAAAAAAAAASNATHECPLNSICSAELIANNQTAYRCKCLANYELNPAYNGSSSSVDSSNATIARNDSISATTAPAAYCLQVVKRIYVREPAKVEHLAFGILMVLFVVIASVVLLYLLKISRPIKRSKAAYTRLKRRREQRQRLEEFNEDDISMIQLHETHNQSQKH